MRKIELTIASDYVPDWTIVDAIRELFQNALDQEAQNPANKASWSYAGGTFTISNKSSALTAESLLLGSTTKAGDNRTIGQFGEGYKIATLVLLRNQKTVTIYNYGLREVWRPRFVQSRRFGVPILTFFIDKEYPWSKVPDNDLTIEVSGITDAEWCNQVVPTNLPLQPAYGIEDFTEYGEALADAEHAGMVFVNGLYVCTYKPYKFGYNFKPGHLNLDRDRKLVSDFDLKWLSSQFWSNNPRAVELAAEGIEDVAYLSSMLRKNHNLPKEAFELFRLVHGPHAVPVSTQVEADRVPPGYKPIIVSEDYKRLITIYPDYEEPIDDTIPPLERLQVWFDGIIHKLSDTERTQFNEIMKELTNE